MNKLYTTVEISKRMSKQKSKQTKAEVVFAKALWHKGYRYRLNYKKLPGSPDIALTKHSIAIFVDGEFWHGKDFDRWKDNIKNNKEFWNDKISKNINRDIKNDQLLREMGWISLHFWSKDILVDVDYCVKTVEEIIEMNYQY